MEEVTLTRRQLIAGSASSGIVLFAGCLSDGGTDEDGDANGVDEDEQDDVDDANQEDDGVEAFPTDPGEDDFIDRTGMAEVEVITREGEDNEPDFVFDPAFVSVDPGTTIQWINEDDYFHTVTSTPDLNDRDGGGDLFNEDIAEAGDTFEWTVDEPGIYHYYCEPHFDFMWGSVAVLDDGEFPDEDPADDDPMDEPDDCPGDDQDDDTMDGDEYTDVPEELPTDPDDDDFIDMTGQDEVEVYTREGRDGEPNFVFDPPFVRVEQETTVRWVNKDGVFHTITSTDSLSNRSGGGSEFDETISSVGDEFSWEADEPGRQDYYCSPHAGFMFGAIDIV